MVPAEREVGGGRGVQSVGEGDDRLALLTKRLLDAFELAAIGRLRTKEAAAEQRHRGDPTRETRSCAHA